mmetsp:Transcript_10237/g.27141  ORF Transcript_10237/g.27141 Transcript_10237/m.27141 type:complete len:341 (+) Transcript_10237:484-1506(+)
MRSSSFSASLNNHHFSPRPGFSRGMERSRSNASSSLSSSSIFWYCCFACRLATCSSRLTRSTSFNASWYVQYHRRCAVFSSRSPVNKSSLSCSERAAYNSGAWALTTASILATRSSSCSAAVQIHHQLLFLGIVLSRRFNTSSSFSESRSELYVVIAASLAASSAFTSTSASMSASTFASSSSSCSSSSSSSSSSSASASASTSALESASALSSASSPSSSKSEVSSASLPSSSQSAYSSALSPSFAFESSPSGVDWATSETRSNLVVGTTPMVGWSAPRVAVEFMDDGEDTGCDAPGEATTSPVALRHVQSLPSERPYSLKCFSAASTLFAPYALAKSE